jgi:hypothetical protein
MAVYELSKLLPEALRPLPMDLVRINDTRSDIVPNAGALLPLPLHPVLVTTISSKALLKSGLPVIM